MGQCTTHTMLDDRAEIESRLRQIYTNASSPYNDGWIASDYKKDLVMIRFMLDRLIKKCPNFGKLEDEWGQEITLKILKDL